MKRGSVSARLEFVERHYHVRKCRHESLALPWQSPRVQSRGPVINANRATLGEERSDTFRILTAPRFRVTRCEFV